MESVGNGPRENEAAEHADGSASSPSRPEDVKKDPDVVKQARILEACRWKDIDGLRALAVSEAGLISDELRCQACRYPLSSMLDNS
jgi:hypothetical protein